MYAYTYTHMLFFYCKEGRKEGRKRERKTKQSGKGTFLQHLLHSNMADHQQLPTYYHTADQPGHHKRLCRGEGG